MMNLKKLRKAAGVSQTTAGNMVGVSRRTIYNYEQNLTPIPKATEEVLEQKLSALAQMKGAS